MNELRPGDVLSYSSGSTQSGPWGFRRLRAERNLLAACAGRWPVLLDALGGRTPLLINAYPANLGRFEFGIVVDSYLSPMTVSRALQLAAQQKHPAVLIGQPLFVADALWRHVRADLALPDTLIFAVAGYVMPRSLQATLEALCTARSCRCHVVHFYGVAEVDAGCLVAMERNAAGELVYHATGPEVGVVVEDSRLLLGLRATSGESIVDHFATGDGARREGDGYVVWNHERYRPGILSRLEGWTSDDWRRRTGYLGADTGLVHQLREGVRAEAQDELGYFEFGARFGFSWLEKPDWSGGKESW
jgi:hypothetical protein